MEAVAAEMMAAALVVASFVVVVEQKWRSGVSSSMDQGGTSGSSSRGVGGTKTVQWRYWLRRSGWE